MKPLKFGPWEVQPWQTATVIARPTEPFAGQRFTCDDDVALAFEVRSIRVANWQQLAPNAPPIRMRDLRGARLKLDTLHPSECMTIEVRNMSGLPATFECELEGPQ